MDAKIKETKIAILNRIQKAVSDDTKSLTAETLTAMSNIVVQFESQEIYKQEPKYDLAEIVKEYFDKTMNKDKDEAITIPEKGEI